MAITLDGVITILILLLGLFLLYTAIKKQSMTDTWEELKEFFTPTHDIPHGI